MKVIKLFLLLVTLMFTSKYAQPVLQSPVDGAVNVTLNPTLQWDAVAGATDYRLQVATDNLFSSVVYDQNLGNVTSQSVSLNDGTQYFWRVMDDVSNTFSGEFSFTTYYVPGNVTLLSPADGSFHNPTNVTLTWNAATNTDDYLVEVADDSSFTNIVYSNSSVTDTFVTVSGLNNYTQYFWRVTAQNTFASGAPSSASFTTKLAAPVLVAPANGATNQSIVPLFDWNSVTGSAPVTYTLEVAKNNTFTSGLITISLLAPDEFQFGPPTYVLENGTTYFYRVFATDSYGNSDYSAVRSFTTVGEIIPVLGWPIGGNGAYNEPQLFSWYLNQYAPGTIYDFELSLNRDLTSPVRVVNDINGTTLSQSLAGLPGNTMLYWRVRSKVSPSVVSHYSEIDSFTIQTPGFVALQPYPSYPTGGTVVYNTSQTLYWYLLAAGSGLTYEIEYNTSGTMTGVPTISGITNLYYALSGLSLGQTYYWSVRSFNGLQYSDWSPVESFTVYGSSTPAEPVPSWPIGGNFVYTVSPTLYWYLNEYAVGLTYDVEYNTTGTFTGVPTVAGVNAQYLTLTGLTPGATYYWKVRSYNGTNYSAWSAVDSFVVYSTVVASAPIPSYPLTGEVVYTLEPTLYWYLNGPSAGLTFDVEFNDNGVFTGTPTFSGLTNTYLTLSTLTAGQTYYYKVRSFDGSNYSSWSATQSFVVVGSGGSLVPVPSWPVGGATVYTTDQQISWYMNGPSLGLTFQVEVSFTGTFTGTPTYTGLTNMYYTLTGLTPGSTVYWKVRSFNGVTPSTWSAMASFVVYDPLAPLMPLTGTPSDGVIINTNAPVISWVLPAPSNNLTYELQIADNPNMTNAIVLNNLTTPKAALDNLNDNTGYYWRVRSKLGNNYSSYSNIAVFNTGNGTTSVKEESVVPTSFFMTQNYPNPFNPTTQIKFGIPSNANVKVVIYNMLGQQIKTLVNSNLAAGTYNLTWDGTNDAGMKVNSGAYIYRITAGNFVESKKMILLK